MVNDNLSDAVTRIRNGYLAGLLEVQLPKVKLVKAACEVLAKHKYIKAVRMDKEGMVVELRYENKKPVLMGIRRCSKPGQRRYAPYKNIPKVWGGLGINILSTNKGLMSEREAKKAKLGGELLIQVW